MATTRPRADRDDPRYRATLKQMIESQAYRELAAANLLGHSLKFVPDLERKRDVAQDLMEELEHFEATVRLYEELGFGDVTAEIRDRLARVPYPESWLELAVAQFLYDRAGKFHLREYVECSFEPYAKAVGRILEEEEEHESFGEEVLRDFCGEDRNRPAAQSLFEKWLPVALLSFGRPATEGDGYAVAAKLKKRGAAAVMQDFLDDIKPTMRACGLRFPPKEATGIEFAPDVDLSL